MAKNNLLGYSELFPRLDPDVVDPEMGFDDEGELNRIAFSFPVGSDPRKAVDVIRKAIQSTVDEEEARGWSKWSDDVLLSTVITAEALLAFTTCDRIQEILDQWESANNKSNLERSNFYYLLCACIQLGQWSMTIPNRRAERPYAIGKRQTHSAHVAANARKHHASRRQPSAKDFADKVRQLKSCGLPRREVISRTLSHFGFSPRSKAIFYRWQKEFST